MFGVLMLTASAIAGLVLWYSEACKKANRGKRMLKQHQKIAERKRAKNGRQLLKQYMDKSKTPFYTSSPAVQRLNSLTHSPELSMRMIRHTATKNPNRSEQWCVEKAIYNIERDRMAR